MGKSWESWNGEEAGSISCEHTWVPNGIRSRYCHDCGLIEPMKGFESVGAHAAYVTLRDKHEALEKHLEVLHISQRAAHDLIERVTSVSKWNQDSPHALDEHVKLILQGAVKENTYLKGMAHRSRQDAIWSEREAEHHKKAAVGANAFLATNAAKRANPWRSRARTLALTLVSALVTLLVLAALGLLGVKGIVMLYNHLF